MRKWIVIVACILSSVLGCAAMYCTYSHRVIKSELSEVYLRYCDRDDLSVAFVKDYRIDDSTVVDVTTLVACDSATWVNLLREMNVKEQTIKKYISASVGERTIVEYYCEEDHPEHHVSIKDCQDFDLVLISFNDRTMYVFDINSDEQGRTTLYYKNNEILTKNTKYETKF